MRAEFPEIRQVGSQKAIVRKRDVGGFRPFLDGLLQFLHDVFHRTPPECPLAIQVAHEGVYAIGTMHRAPAGDHGSIYRTPEELVFSEMLGCERFNCAPTLNETVRWNLCQNREDVKVLLNGTSRILVYRAVFPIAEVFNVAQWRVALDSVGDIEHDVLAFAEADVVRIVHAHFGRDRGMYAAPDHGDVRKPRLQGGRQHLGVGVVGRHEADAYNIWRLFPYKDSERLHGGAVLLIKAVKIDETRLVTMSNKKMVNGPESNDIKITLEGD